MVMRLVPTSSTYETEIGLNFYSTSPPGAGGVAKLYPWDFVVDEVYPPFIRASLLQSTHLRAGRYRCYVLSKIGHTTMYAAAQLAKAAKISVDAIRYAGIKDKRAISHQIVTIPAASRITSQSLPQGIKVRYIGYSSHHIATRELKGNVFRIRIIGASSKRIQQLAAELRESGCLNYFGYQRFGIPTPVNLLIAKAVLQADLQLLEQAIKESPYATPFSYEAKVIRRLKDRRGDISRAISALPPRVLSIILQSYQAYLFNRVLSILADNGFNFTRVRPGTIVKIFERYVVARTSWDAAKLTKLCSSGIASICVPIPGYSTLKLYRGPLSQALSQALREAGLSHADVKRWPSQLAGAIRSAVLWPKFLEVDVDRNSVVLSFYLERGGYASIVLREFMKSSRIEDYEGGLRPPLSR